MILLLRVDHRLLHGQVAVSWCQGLGANCVFCVGDHVANDPVWKTTLKLGKPAGCKLVIKDMDHAVEAINSGVTDKYRMVVSVQTIAEAKELADRCPVVTSINLGNTKASPTTREVSRQVFLEPEEEAMIRELVDRGVEVEIRPLADDPKVDAASVL
ncbi:PTS sugar transporter [Granulimonas faecalis]|uniref:PTS sugar transporter n=1 Tax=Granulimonas faecalis TaxID=2894155 RepID=A0AAV5AXI8_9ACTN|nr:PTS sugar transporter subunit IIB [Granulimonas faecalis]MBF0599721.1 PTS sugar transporter subunit IIB [Atopobiaceae bacterium FL090493]GJM54499.1 PTS sugar transporter [Granulimonas faecalis]